MKKNKKLLHQFLIPVLIVIAVLAVVILTADGIIFFRTFDAQVKRDNLTENILIADNVAAFLSEAYALSEELANDPDILTMETDIQTPVLEACVERNPYLELLYIQDENGMQTGRSSGELADRSSRWWFLQMQKERQPFISKSYYSVNTTIMTSSRE